jgi:uncharacterized delta-60 repeat protein
MRISSLLRAKFRGACSSNTRRSSSLSRPSRPILEQLEDRVVPSAGSLDPTFGTGGKLTTDFLTPDYVTGEAVVTQSDGKIVVAGNVKGAPYTSVNGAFLARYNSNGTLDTSFGSGGRIGFLSGQFTSVGDLLIQPDGKLVVGGVEGLSLVLERFNPDGTLDSGFGTGGEVVTNLTDSNRSIFGFQAHNFVTIQPNGMLVVVGGAGYPSQFGVERFNSNGMVDQSFGANGEVVTNFGGDAAMAESVAIGSDGRIVATGALANASNAAALAIARYNADGSLDASFHGNGTEVIGAAFGFTEGLFVEADNSVLIAGTGFGLPYGGNFTLVHLNADGSLDAGFANGGIVSYAFSTDNFGRSASPLSSATLQPDGKIVAAGTAYQIQNIAFSPTSGHFVVARFNSNGSLDTSFGGAGHVTTDIGVLNSAQAVTVQADGKLLVAGSAKDGLNSDLGLARYNPDGTMDANLGSAGTVRSRFLDSGNDAASAVVQQPDGKLVVVGTSTGGCGSQASLARYNPDGTLDASFGADGQVLTQFATQFAATSTILQPDGKILVGGAWIQPTTSTFGLVRFNPDGTLDTTFGTGGQVITGSNLFTILGLSLQADGKIIGVGGDPSNGIEGHGFEVARFNPDGSLDTSFNGTGLVITYLDNTFSATAFSAAVQADGKIVVGGDSVGTFALARYNPDGSLDTSFNGTGTVTTPGIVAGGGEISSLAIQPDGKILAAGAGGTNFIVARYNPNGTLDHSFGGGDGIFARQIGDSGSQFGAGLALQSDGKILLASTIHYPNAPDVVFGVIRLLPHGILDRTFGHLGVATADFGGSGFTQPAGMVLQSDGNIVVVGQTGSPATFQDFAVTRLLGGDRRNGSALMSDPTDTASAGALLATNLTVYVDNSSGLFTSDEQARICDAVAALSSEVAPYGVRVTEVDTSQYHSANVVIDIGTSSAAGGYADGVLGCETDSGEITLILGWNWYTGADASQIRAGQYDFETIVTHEIGHALGLGHSSDPTSVMYASLATGQPKRSLAAADLMMPDLDYGACALHAATARRSPNENPTSTLLSPQFATPNDPSLASALTALLFNTTPNSSISPAVQLGTVTQALPVPLPIAPMEAAVGQTLGSSTGRLNPAAAMKALDIVLADVGYVGLSDGLALGVIGS